VDIERPENNRELFIFNLKDVEAKDKKSFYCGYTIGLQVDPRFIVDDLSCEPFEAVVLSANSILVSMPAYPFSFLQEEFYQHLRAMSNDFLANAFDNARHDYVEETNDYEGEDRKTKHLLLQFPDNHEFSVEPIIDKDRDEDDRVLPFDTLTLEANHDFLKGENQQVWIVWRVLRTNIRAMKRGKIEKKNKMSQIASKFQGLVKNPNSMKNV